MLSCWPNLLFLFVFYNFIFFFLPWDRCVGWGFRIKSVLILSQPCIADSFLIIIIILISGGSDFTILVIVCRMGGIFGE